MSDDAQTIEGIDDAVDDWWERALRGRPTLDRLMYSASEGRQPLAPVARAGSSAGRDSQRTIARPRS